MKKMIYPLVWTVARLYMIGALAISFSHIIDASHQLELFGWAALTVPFAIDGLALLGMIGRSSQFAESTQRTGFKLQIGAGAVSLAANVYAGDTRGERMYGILIILLFVIVEWYAAQLKPALTPAQELAARRSAAAKQSAATRKANAATKAPATKKKTTKAPPKTTPAKLPTLTAVPNVA